MQLRPSILQCAVALSLSLSLANGAVVYTGAANSGFITLEELFVGGSISVNNLTFENWSLEQNVVISDHGSLAIVDPGDVRVTGLDDMPFTKGSVMPLVIPARKAPAFIM